MDNFKDNDIKKLFIPLGRPSHVSVKPLGASNMISSFDRKAGFYGSLPKSAPQGIRKTLFEPRNKENEETILGTDFLSDKEVTGKSPVIVVHKTKNVPHSNEGKEKKQVHPRRSMLGQRGKSLLPSVHKDDTYTLSRPLHCSSPLANERYDNYNADTIMEPKLTKATSTPTLNHPFDINDADASSFFNKGLSDSVWSVFKPNKKSKKTESYPSETPLSRVSSINGQSRLGGGENTAIREEANWKGKQNSAFLKGSNNWAPSIKPSPMLPSADPKMKLEWLTLKFQQNETQSNDSKGEKSTENKNCIENKGEKNSQKRFEVEKSQSGRVKGESQNNTMGIIRTRAQLKKEKEKKNMPEVISPITSKNECLETQQSPGSVSQDNNMSQNSTDSYVQHENTIVGTGRNNLPDINEEVLSKLTISDNKNDEETEYTDASEEFLSSDDISVGAQDLGCILNLMHDLENEKEELNTKFLSYLKQKESFDKKWDNFTLVFSTYVSSNDKASRKTSTVVLNKSKQKKIICTKGKRSFISPRGNLLSNSSKMTTGKNYSDLKANFSCLKTPVQATKHLQRLRKSTCYTPNSLSVLVGDQVKDIFGE